MIYKINIVYNIILIIINNSVSLVNLGYNTIVLFSGDFNMIPCSGLYNYMAHGLINVKECASAIVKFKKN